MPERWVVLLEVAGDGAQRPITAREVRRLQEALDQGRHGALLYSPDRYALQLAATGASPVEALVEAVARWADAVGHLSLPVWKLVRTEVFTPEDLEREFERAQRAEILVQQPGPDHGIGEHHDAGHELLRRAFSDPLTGLLGPRAFAHRVEAAAVDARGRFPMAVVRLDLDRFQHVNHDFGEAVADQVLIALAQRLRAMLRPGDVLARLGGDEYALLLENITEDAAVAVARRMLDACRLPITISGRDLTLTAKAGVVVSQSDEDGEAVVDNAGVALLAAKAVGGPALVLHPSDVSGGGTRQDLPTTQLQDRLAHLQLLQQATVAANEADRLDEAARVVVRHICTQVGCSLGHLWSSPTTALEDVPPTSLWHTAGAGDDRGLQEAAEELLSAGAVGLRERVLATGRPVWIADVAADTDALPGAPVVAAGLHSAFAFPVLVGREVVAGMAFFSRTRMAPTPSFLDVLASIGTQLGRVVERQRAAEALRLAAERLGESQARLRQAQHLARLGSWHVEVPTGERTWSEGMHDLYGLEAGHRLDLGSVMATVHPEDRSRAEAALLRLVETEEPTAWEARIVRPDGEVRWHRSVGAVIKDDDGEVVAIKGTTQDVTEAKVAEQALLERERRLAEAQRAAGLGWWERDLSTGQLTWSHEMYRLWGREPGQEISVEAFLATIHPADLRRVLEGRARLHHTGEPICVDFRAIVADGRQRWFRGGAHLLRDEDGVPVKLLGTAQDITEQKDAEENLRAARDLYQRIVETAHEGIVTVDAHDVITFVNPRMAQILGYSVEEMTGMAGSVLVDDETKAGLSRHRKRRREGMSEHYETVLRAKDGAVVQVLVSASPFMDEEGHYTGALAMVTDITAVREAEEILRSQSRQVRAEVDQGHADQEPPGF